MASECGAYKHGDVKGSLPASVSGPNTRLVKVKTISVTGIGDRNSRREFPMSIPPWRFFSCH